MSCAHEEIIPLGTRSPAYEWQCLECGDVSRVSMATFAARVRTAEEAESVVKNGFPRTRTVTEEE